MNNSNSSDNSSVVFGFGPQPLEWISKTVKICGKDAVMDPGVARMAGANLAVGAPAALAELRRRLEAGSLAATRSQVPDDAPAGSVQWLATGERGASSEALFTRLSGIIPASRSIRKAVNHPYDPDDLRRCRLMLEAVPSLQVKLHEAADLSPQWAELIKDWVGLTALMDEECPDWREAMGRKAPLTYTRMRNLLGRAPQPT